MRGRRRRARGRRRPDARRDRGSRLTARDRTDDPDGPPTLWTDGETVERPTTAADGGRRGARAARRGRADGAPLRLLIRTDGAARGNPGPASSGAALYDLAPARRPQRQGRSGRVDLRLSRDPDQQRRRVHGRRPRARARPRPRGARGPPPPRFEAHRRAARRPLAGQGREADPALVGGPQDARRLRPLDRGARAARPELGRRPAGQRGDRPGAGGRAGLGRAPALTGRGRRGTAAPRPPSGDRENPHRPDGRRGRAHRPARRRVRRVQRARPARPTPSPAARDARGHELGRGLGRRPAVGPGEHAVHRVHGRPRAGHRRVQPVRWQLHVRPDDRHAQVRRADDDAHGLHRPAGRLRDASSSPRSRVRSRSPRPRTAAATSSSMVRRAGSSSRRPPGISSAGRMASSARRSDGRAAAGRPVRREESPSSSAQGGG